MGRHLVNAVFFGLEGVAPDVLFPIPAKGKKGRQFRTFGGDEMAILAAVAHRQPDPGYRGNVDTFAYGDIQTMLDLSHVGRSSFFEKRDALVQWKLLSYAKEQKLPDISGMGGMKRYSNVYRINLEGIRQYRSGLSDAEWARNVLRMTDEEKMRLSGNLLRAFQISGVDTTGKAAKSVQNADGTVQNADCAVQTADGGVQTADCAVQNTDTNTTINTKTNQKEQSSPTRPVMIDGADDDWVLFMEARAAEKCECPLEQINDRCFREAIRDKYTRSVAKAIKTFEPGNLKNPIGGLICRLRALPHFSGDPAWLNDKKTVRIPLRVVSLDECWPKVFEALRFDYLLNGGAEKIYNLFKSKADCHASWENWPIKFLEGFIADLGIKNVEGSDVFNTLKNWKLSGATTKTCANELHDSLAKC